MALQIRTVTDDEFADWSRVISTAFFGNLPSAEQIADRRQNVDLDRCWAAFDGAQPVATLRTFPAQLTLPGAVAVPADAVTSVTTLSTHRRQGALTGHDDGIARAGRRAWRPGQHPDRRPLADLRPVRVRPGHRGDAAEGRHPRRHGGRHAAGSLEFTDAATARAVAEPVYDAYRRGQVGAITRRSWIFDQDFALVEVKGSDPWKGYCVVHRDGDGHPDGYLRYHVDDTWHGFEPDCTLIIDDLIATTPARTRTCGACASRPTTSRRSRPTTAVWTSRCAGCSTTGAPSPSTSAATSSGYASSTCRRRCRRVATSPRAGWSSRSTTRSATPPAGTRWTAGPTARPAPVPRTRPTSR